MNLSLTTAATDNGATLKAAQALRQGDFEGGIALLDAQAPAASGQAQSAESLALLALAHFQLEHYALAARYYGLAIDASPEAAQAENWRAMLSVAQGNAISEVDVHVPALSYFDRETLLAPPRVEPGALPEPLPARPLSSARALRKWVGELLGAVGTTLGGASRVSRSK